MDIFPSHVTVYEHEASIIINQATVTFNGSIKLVAVFAACKGFALIEPDGKEANFVDVHVTVYGPEP